MRGLRTFPKARRIGRRSDFQRIYDKGGKAHGRFMTLFVFSNDLATSRLGVTATRKIGSAVRRNRAKRRVRELFRTSDLPAGLDLVVIVRRDLIDAPWDALRGEFHGLLAGRRTRGRSRGV